MMLLLGIANAAMIWALVPMFMWHSSTDVRIALAGIYLGVGTVALSGFCLLWQLDKQGRR
jgi:hypothetical protein